MQTLKRSLPLKCVFWKPNYSSLAKNPHSCTTRPRHQMMFPHELYQKWNDQATLSEAKMIRPLFQKPKRSGHFFRSWNDQATLAHDLTIWPEADYYMASSIADGQQATPEPNISQMFHKAISFISHTYHEIILSSHWHSSSTHQAWKALPASTIYTFISLSMTVNNIQCFSTLQLSVHHPCECLRRLR